MLRCIACGRDDLPIDSAGWCTACRRPPQASAGASTTEGTPS